MTTARISDLAWPEAARLAALRQYEILDTPADPTFDAITRLAARICGTPKAAFGLIDRERVWFKSEVGLGVSEIPRDLAFCDRTIRSDGLCIVRDATLDPTFRDSPLVTGPLQVRFYAGVPVRCGDGLPIGTLSILDREPRELEPFQTEALIDLARQLTELFELGLVRRGLRTTLDRVAGGVFTVDHDFRVTFANGEASRLLGDTQESIASPALSGGLHKAMREGVRHRFEAFHEPGDRWLEVTAEPLDDGLTAHVSDITGRKREELQQRASNRVLRLIALGGALTTILRACARSISDVSPGQRASILLVDPDTARLKLGAAPHLPLSFISVLDGLAIGPTAACCGTAVHRRELTVATSIGDSPLWAGLHSVAASHGLRACWSMPILHSDGSVVAAFAVYRDTAKGPTEADIALLDHFVKLAALGIEHVRREEALRESERRALQLAENVDEIFWIATVHDNRVLYVNSAYEKISGRRCEDLYRSLNALIDAIHPEDRARIELPATRFPNGSHLNEYRLIRPDGAVRWIEDRSFPVHDNQGRLIRLVGIAKDVTDAKNAECRLRESEERLSIVAQTTADVVWDWNLSSDMIRWNDGLKLHFKHEFGPDAPSASWKNHIHPDDRERVVAGIYAVINGPINDWQDEYRFLCGDGSSIVVIDRGRVIRDDAGKPLRMVGSMIDVTQQRHLEEQLRQSQRLDAVGKLTGGVAHDFNNILMVIAANVEALQEEIVDRSVAERLDRIGGAARRAADLTRQLLAFSRKQTLRPQITDLNELITVTGSLLHRTLGGEIDIDMRLADGLGHTSVDRSQFETALVNLCINARDAMPAGGRLVIETGNVSFGRGNEGDIAPGDYVMLSVTDSGTGMPADVASRAFDPFFTTKDVGKGSGLGLSMVHGFVHQSKGHVDIKSQVGWGTTVRIYLPKVEGTSEQLAAQREATPHGKERILLVEDNDEVRFHVSAMLASLGYEVTSAASGREALELLDRVGEVDLLFTDVVMPGGMNGREVAEEVRRARPGLRVLFTSGYAEGALQNDGRLESGVLLLPKPYRKRDLAQKVREALSAPPGAVPGPASTRQEPAGKLNLVTLR
ncbi:PAS domain-containing protein [Reyranella sp.]|uniref:PAS domain-containing protein n=1 Tax=Reyranella sp. TaxID=1929291 RepID=UPI00121A58F9|nr:PAS domain-containing protein [Reyranella sp.]TAJ84933.1 MAG: PAS domain S-box protein [Reyranella sp.]